MKITLFSDTFLPQINGVTNTLSRLKNYLEIHNYDYIFLVPEHNEDKISSDHIKRFFSLKFFLYPECRLSFPTLRKLKKTLEQFNPDIVQLMTEFNMGIAGMNYARKHKLPAITNYSTNFSTYLKYYNLTILENACWKYMQWFHNQGDLTLCPSNETLKVLKQNKINNVSIFGRGVDCKMFTPDNRSIEFRRSLGIENKIVLLYVGRIAIEKDLNILFEAYKGLKQIYKNQIVLVITGNGPMLDKYKKEYNDDIIYTGYKSGLELSKIYAMADIFTFPSPTETLGNVVLEAMASGLPVVGVYEGGVKENLIEDYNGICCREKNVDDFVKGIQKLINNYGLRNQLAINARNYALTKSWESVFDNLISTYEEIIENKKMKKVI